MFGRGKNRSEDNGRWKSGEKIKLVCLVEETKKKWMEKSGMEPTNFV